MAGTSRGTRNSGNLEMKNAYSLRIIEHTMYKMAAMANVATSAALSVQIMHHHSHMRHNTYRQNYPIYHSHYSHRSHVDPQPYNSSYSVGCPIDVAYEEPMRSNERAVWNNEPSQKPQVVLQVEAAPPPKTCWQRFLEFLLL